MHQRLNKTVAYVTLLALVVSMLPGLPAAWAAPLYGLPEPGARVALSPAYRPPVLAGLTVYKKDPFRFDFIVDPGERPLQGPSAAAEGQRLIRYFMAALAIEPKDTWVNLSPYEGERIVPDALGHTDMGRDLLAQDYLLKQLSASLLDPDGQLGKEFWARVYSQSRAQLGTTQIPINTFNKVWITVDTAQVTERGQSVFVVACHLKVMLEQDYAASSNNVIPAKAGIHSKMDARLKHSGMTSKAIRDIILPVLEKEVNEGTHFAQLRQMCHSILLASWYKKRLRDSILNELYANKANVHGIDVADASFKESIYRQYLAAYKKGVLNFIREEPAPDGGTVPRKYFSGGFAVSPALEDPSVVSRPLRDTPVLKIGARLSSKDSAQLGAQVRALQESEWPVVRGVRLGPGQRWIRKGTRYRGGEVTINIMDWGEDTGEVRFKFDNGAPQKRSLARFTQLLGGAELAKGDVAAGEGSGNESVEGALSVRPGQRWRKVYQVKKGESEVIDVVIVRLVQPNGPQAGTGVEIIMRDKRYTFPLEDVTKSLKEFTLIFDPPPQEYMEFLDFFRSLLHEKFFDVSELAKRLRQDPRAKGLFDRQNLEEYLYGTQWITGKIFMELRGALRRTGEITPAEEEELMQKFFRYVFPLTLSDVEKKWPLSVSVPSGGLEAIYNRSRKLAFVRQVHGWSQEVMAGEMGLKTTSYRKIEWGLPLRSFMENSDMYLNTLIQNAGLNPRFFDDDVPMTIANMRRDGVDNRQTADADNRQKGGTDNAQTSDDQALDDPILDEKKSDEEMLDGRAPILVKGKPLRVGQQWRGSVLYRGKILNKASLTVRVIGMKRGGIASGNSEPFVRLSILDQDSIQDEVDLSPEKAVRILRTLVFVEPPVAKDDERRHGPAEAATVNPWYAEFHKAFLGILQEMGITSLAELRAALQGGASGPDKPETWAHLSEYWNGRDKIGLSTFRGLRKDLIRSRRLSPDLEEKLVQAYFRQAHGKFLDELETAARGLPESAQKGRREEIKIIKKLLFVQTVYAVDRVTIQGWLELTVYSQVADLLSRGIVSEKFLENKDRIFKSFVENARIPNKNFFDDHTKVTLADLRRPSDQPRASKDSAQISIAEKPILVNAQELNVGQVWRGPVEIMGEVFNEASATIDALGERPDDLDPYKMVRFVSFTIRATDGRVFEFRHAWPRMAVKMLQSMRLVTSDSMENEKKNGATSSRYKEFMQAFYKILEQAGIKGLEDFKVVLKGDQDRMTFAVRWPSPAYYWNGTYKLSGGRFLMLREALWRAGKMSKESEEALMQAYFKQEVGELVEDMESAVKDLEGKEARQRRIKEIDMIKKLVFIRIFYGVTQRTMQEWLDITGVVATSLLYHGEVTGKLAEKRDETLFNFAEKAKVAFTFFDPAVPMTVENMRQTSENQRPAAAPAAQAKVDPNALDVGQVWIVDKRQRDGARVTITRIDPPTYASMGSSRYLTGEGVVHFNSGDETPERSLPLYLFRGLIARGVRVDAAQASDQQAPILVGDIEVKPGQTWIGKLRVNGVPGDYAVKILGFGSKGVGAKAVRVVHVLLNGQPLENPIPPDNLRGILAKLKLEVVQGPKPGNGNGKTSTAHMEGPRYVAFLDKLHEILNKAGINTPSEYRQALAAARMSTDRQEKWKDAAKYWDGTVKVGPALFLSMWKTLASPRAKLLSPADRDELARLFFYAEKGEFLEKLRALKDALPAEQQQQRADELAMLEKLLYVQVINEYSQEDMRRLLVMADYEPIGDFLGKEGVLPAKFADHKEASLAHFMRVAGIQNPNYFAAGTPLRVSDVRKDAPAAPADPLGGIDLNTEKTTWSGLDPKGGVEVAVDEATLARWRSQGLQSLTPQIISITPVSSILSLGN